MALSDIMKLVDDKLHDVFHAEPHDPKKARKPFLSGIAKVRKQFEAGKQPRQSKQMTSRGEKPWWSAKNNVVAFSPNSNGTSYKIGGRDTLYIPSERFPEFLTGLESSVHAGELDDQFGNAGSTTSRASTRKSPLAGRGWSDARRAAHAAKKGK